MLISIHDRTLERVGFLSNDDSESPDFKDDNFHRYLAQGTSTFDFTVNKIKNGVVQDYVQLLNEHAYFSFQYEGEDFLFDSVIVEEDDDKITFNCLTLNLEMRNEQVKELKNTATHNIQWYFDQMGLINFAKITLGINEVSSYTRVINYDGEDTKLSRLISVIQNFDGEFEFVTKLKRDGTLDNITLNIYKKNDNGDIQGVGQDRNDVLLSFGDNISGVSRKVEKAQIFNSIYVTGKDGLSWKDSAWSVSNSEGQEEFYKRAGESYAKAPLSAQMFPSQLKSSSGDIFTNKNEATEYTTVNAMWGYALSQLKQYAYPLISYEVTATSNLTVSSTGDGTPLHIGDTVRIQDKNFIDSDGNVGLFLSARVSELEISFTNPTNNKITFSNYIKLKSEVSDDLTARMQEIINANTPYRSDITSTNGLQFKNGTGTTTLGAHIYFGSDDKETTADSYEWSKDGTVVTNAQTITVDASGVADKAVYSFKATVAGKVVASQSVTITNVNDGAKGAQGPQGPQGPQGLKGDPGATGIPGQAGADGKTSYLHIAYATNSTGTAGFDVSNATGKTYIGQYTDFTANDSTDPSKYAWTLIKGDKGDKGATGPQGPQGERGIAGATGATGSPGPKGADGRSSYIHIKYAPVINPTDSQITDTPNAYIGVYTDYNQADSTSASTYTWSKWQGEDGANGVAGAKGADGRTTYVHFAYANSTNGQTNFSTSYFDGALYMGTLTDYTQTDSTNYAAYTWSRLKGDKGDKGDQGVQGIQGLQGPAGTQGVAGPKGADGKTQYTHIAYANSADGRKDFSTSDSNRTYIGMYVDFNINDSTTPSDYSWTLVKGADGTQGTPGKPGADGKTPYFHTAWSYSADGTKGFTTVYPNLNLLTDSKDFKNKNVTVSKATTSIISPDSTILKEGNDTYLHFSRTEFNRNDWFRAYMILGSSFSPNFPNVDVKPNSQYTFSVWLKGTGTHTIYAYDKWTIPNPTTLTVKLTDKWTKYVLTVNTATTIPTQNAQFFIRSDNVGSEINLKYPKAEPDSTATPHMPSASEVTTADWPSYIGQYTDFTQADSTNPSAYTWSLIRGNDGADGQDGKNGTNGKDGDPGKIVSDTEPTTRFKGLTWKYSGTTDLTASDRTVIKPNTEYYYNGTHWMINFVEANQIKVNDLSAISGTYTNGSIKNVTIDGSVTSTILIEKKHILFTFSDSSQNTTNTLELDSQQGYANTFADSNSGRTRTVQANFQGFFTSDTDGPSAQLTPYGVYVTNGLQTTTVSLGSGINATLAKIGQMCQISINSNSSNVPAGNGVALSGNIPAGWRPAIGTPFEVMMYRGTAFQRPLHITIGTDGKLSIVNVSASSYWCFGGTVYMLA
ncbi:serine/threonine protein phosphatase [Lactococcus lactis subsp. lactis]